MSKYKDQIRAYLGQMDLKAIHVLSIGGGQEDDKKYFKSVEFRTWDVLDNNEEFRPNINFDINRPVSGEGGFEISDQLLGYFDHVIMLNVAEYLHDPITALKNVYDFLDNRGTLIANFPFVYPLHKPVGTDLLRYTPEGVFKFMKMACLDVVKFTPIYGDDLLLDYYAADGLKARDGFDHKIIGLIVEARKG